MAATLMLACSNDKSGGHDGDEGVETEVNGTQLDGNTTLYGLVTDTSGNPVPGVVVSDGLTFGWAANAPAMNDAKCIVANVWNSDASGNWKVSLWQNGTKVCDMTRVKTYDYWAYAYHVLYYSKSVGTTWGKNLDHYYYGNLASGTPETADFEIVAEDGMGNTYRTSKLQTDFIGF